MSLEVEHRKCRARTKSLILTVAIIGVGNVGAALGERLTASGHEVRFGVRPGREIEELLARCDGRAQALPPAEAVKRLRAAGLRKAFVSSSSDEGSFLCGSG